MSGTPIGYRVRACSLGRLLVAGTPRGVCFVRLGAADAPLRRDLERELPWAEIRSVRNGHVREWSDAIARYVDGASASLDVPLDVRGSAFQRRVWSALRRIPRGATRSYAEVARAVGAPQAARAVARACAANPTPVVTPCHRVVPRRGGVGGYALGVRRKRALLAAEGALPEA
jgi:AraC family transcriptional regulator of adaptative response/methylated-DNA-[protein]-cysteine methyltransferase